MQAEVLVGQMRGAQLLAALAAGTKMRKAWERGNKGSNRRVQALIQDRRLMIHYPSGWRRKAVSHFVNRYLSHALWSPDKIAAIALMVGVICEARCEQVSPSCPTVA